MKQMANKIITDAVGLMQRELRIEAINSTAV
jgi:hypothetical protein